MTNIDVRQGADVGHRWLVNDGAGDPYDFTGWSVRAQVRRIASSEPVLHEWSTDDDSATVNSSGQLTLITPAAVSSEWAWGSGVYDVLLTSPTGEVLFLDGGSVTVVRAVTRG